VLIDIAAKGLWPSLFECLLCSGGNREHEQDRWIFVLSDGSGHTGKRVLEAALLQFDQVAMVVRVPHIGNIAEVNEVVTEAAHRRALIVYTLVLLTYDRPCIWLRLNME
jgi:hypothetical protein